jgi:hypothetical protein
VEQVGAVVLEVDALAGGVGGDEDPQRVPSRVGVEGALDLLARSSAMPPVNVANRSWARSVSSMAALSCCSR